MLNLKGAKHDARVHRSTGQPIRGALETRLARLSRISWLPGFPRIHSRLRAFVWLVGTVWLCRLVRFLGFCRRGSLRRAHPPPIRPSLLESTAVLRFDVTTNDW